MIDTTRIKQIASDEWNEECIVDRKSSSLIGMFT